MPKINVQNELITEAQKILSAPDLRYVSIVAVKGPLTHPQFAACSVGVTSPKEYIDVFVEFHNIMSQTLKKFPLCMQSAILQQFESMALMEDEL